MSKYKSEDPAVQTALRQTNTVIAIPFFILLIGFQFGGFTVVYYYNLPGWMNLISVFGGIGMTGLIIHHVSKWWFKKHLLRVRNKHEFTRRAIRLQMMIPSTARKIAEPYLTEEHASIANVPTIISFNKNVKITDGKLFIGEQSFTISSIQDFSVYNPVSGNSRSSRVILKMNIGSSIKVGIPSQFIRDFEFELDRQIAYYQSNRLNTQK